MTKNEALKAAIDGKKVKCESWLNKNKYIEWQKHRFVVRAFGCDNQQDACDSISLYNNDDWQIVYETVDFATAWQAYERGETIQSCVSGRKHKIESLSLIGESGNMMFMLIHDIRGEWLILEDNA